MTVATEHVLYFVATIVLLTLTTTGQPRVLYGRRGNRVLLEDNEPLSSPLPRG